MRVQHKVVIAAIYAQIAHVVGDHIMQPARAVIAGHADPGPAVAVVPAAPAPGRGRGGRDPETPQRPRRAPAVVRRQHRGAARRDIRLRGAPSDAPG